MPMRLMKTSMCEMAPPSVKWRGGGGEVIVGKTITCVNSRLSCPEKKRETGDLLDEPIDTSASN